MKGCRSPVGKIHEWRAGPAAESYQRMYVFENFGESLKSHMKLQPWSRYIPAREGAGVGEKNCLILGRLLYCT